jgi:ATP-binding cassette, subfamily C, bacteriocin exporter
MKKAIQVKQRDVSDCGAACLASVAAYFGLYIPVSRIRQYAGTDKQGTSLHGLTEAAEQLHFQARGAKAAGVAFQGIPVPTIFHQVLENGLQHFVVVYKIKAKRVCYMDPAMGKLISSPIPDFKKKWSGVILLLIPSEQFRRGNEKKSVYRRFWQLIKPHRTMLLQALLGALVYTLLGLSASIYVQKIVDFVLPDANRQLMNMLSLMMILLLCFQVITGYLKSMIALRTGQQIDSRLILGYYKHLLELPQRFFDSMRVGEIISRVNDALRIRIFINDIALNLIVYGLTIILSMTAMFLYYWKLALVMLLTIPLYLLIYLISNKVNAKWQRKIMESGAALESQLVESIQGVTTIRRFVSASYFNLKTENRFIPLMRSIFAGSHSGLLISNATEWMTSLWTIIILWSGSWLVMDQILSPGELLSFYTLTAFFTTPVQALIGANKPMQDALIAADRLFEIIDLETEKENKEGLGIEYFPEGDLVFENAHFNYGPGNTVLNGLNLRIPRHQMTAIIGESGCGKSTLLSLIQRIYPLNAGNILIGDMNIQYISTRLLRKRIAAVPQQTDLFQGDFISNIALGEHEPDLERIYNICRRLNLHIYIDQLPERYHTMIREQGMNLSGGQKQRIGIARALYMDPSILILDEATSALDPESERIVQDTLKWFLDQEKTILVIAHQLNTIRHCGHVIFLKQGGQIMSGTHEELLYDNHEYAGWWNNTLKG